MAFPFDESEGIPEGFSTTPNQLDYYRRAPAVGGMAIPNPPDPIEPAPEEDLPDGVSKLYEMMDREKQAQDLYDAQDAAIGKQAEGVNVEDFGPEFEGAQERGAKIGETIERNPWINKALTAAAVPTYKALKAGTKQVARGHLAALDYAARKGGGIKSVEDYDTEEMGQAKFEKGQETTFGKILHDPRMDTDVKWALEKEAMPYWKKLGFDMVEQVPQLFAQAVSTLAPGGQFLGLAVMGSQIFGNNLEELKEKGWDEDQAAKAAAVQAMWESPLEMLSFHFMLNFTGPLKGVKGQILNRTVSGLGEGFTEFIQSAGSIPIRSMFADASKHSFYDETIGEALKQAVDEGVVGMALGAVLGGGQLQFESKATKIMARVMADLRTRLSKDPSYKTKAEDIMSAVADAQIRADRDEINTLGAQAGQSAALFSANQRIIPQTTDALKTPQARQAEIDRLMQPPLAEANQEIINASGVDRYEEIPVNKLPATAPVVNQAKPAPKRTTPEERQAMIREAIPEEPQSAKERQAIIDRTIPAEPEEPPATVPAKPSPNVTAHISAIEKESQEGPPGKYTPNRAVETNRLLKSLEEEHKKGPPGKYTPATAADLEVDTGAIPEPGQAEAGFTSSMQAVRYGWKNQGSISAWRKVNKMAKALKKQYDRATTNPERIAIARKITHLSEATRVMAGSIHPQMLIDRGMPLAAVRTIFDDSSLELSPTPKTARFSQGFNRYAKGKASIDTITKAQDKTEGVRVVFDLYNKDTKKFAKSVVVEDYGTNDEAMAAALSRWGSQFDLQSAQWFGVQGFSEFLDSAIPGKPAAEWSPISRSSWRMDKSIRPENAPVWDYAFGDNLTEEQISKNRLIDRAYDSYREKYKAKKETRTDTLIDRINHYVKRALEMKGGYTPADMVVYQTEGTKANADLGKVLQEVLGLKVNYFKVDASIIADESLRRSLRGATLTTDDIGSIWINDELGNTVHFTVGHETYHYLKRTFPALAADLDRVLDANIKWNSPEYRAFYESHLEGYSAAHGEDASARIADEYRAFVMGEVFNEASFWNRLQRKNPGLFQRIIGYLSRVISSFTGYKGKYKTAATRATAQIEEVLDTASSVYAELKRTLESDHREFVKNRSKFNDMFMELDIEGIKTEADALNLMTKIGGPHELYRYLIDNGASRAVATRIRNMALAAEKFPFPTPQETMEDALLMWKERPEVRFWYDEVSKLKSVFANESDFNTFRGLAIIAHASRNSDPLTNIIKFISFYKAWKAGETGIVLPLVEQDKIDALLQAKDLDSMFRTGTIGVAGGTERVEGERKVLAFARTFAAVFKGDPVAREAAGTVIDVWMSRYFYPQLHIPKVTGKVYQDINYSWKSYAEAQEEAWSDKNILVKTDPNATNGERVLMVQISSTMARDEATKLGDVYFDKLYNNRNGYERPRDFWEIPEWIALGAANLPKSDVYVVRNVHEATRFLKKAGYKTVMFSAMDANKDVIKKIVDSYSGKVVAGGYVDPAFFSENKNVTFVDNFQKAIKGEGFEPTSAVDYRHFKGTATVPRFTLSEGCLHRCAFCTVPKTIKMADAAKINAQIASFKDLDYQLVYINDKTFGQAENFSKLSGIYRKLKKQNPNFKGFVIQTTASQFMKFDEQFIKDSHIRFVEFGVESYNDEILARLKKPHRIKQIDAAVERLRRLKLNFIPNVMVGLAGKVDGKVWNETSETYQKTLDFLNRNRDVISHVNAYVLATYNGTALGEELGVNNPVDMDENVIEKSWLSEKKVHEKFYADVMQFGAEALDAGDLKVSKPTTEVPEREKKVANFLSPSRMDRIEAHMGEVRKLIEEKTGEKWFPDQVQALVWFYTKRFWEKNKIARPKVGMTFDQALDYVAAKWMGIDRPSDEVSRAYINQKLRDPNVRWIMDHWTRDSNDFVMADPKFQGTALAGEEWTNQDPNNPRPLRIHFYEAGNKPEEIFGQGFKRMRAVVDSSKIYDIGRDPVGYKQKYGLLHMGRKDPFALAEMEKEIIRDGYIGMVLNDYDTGRDMSVVVMFETTRVDTMKRYAVSASPLPQESLIKQARIMGLDAVASRMETFLNLYKNGEYDKLLEHTKALIGKWISSPMIDIRAVSPAHGRWKGGKEFSVDIDVESGDFEILAGAVAKFLKDSMQFEGYISNVASRLNDPKRPAGFPAEQRPTYIFSFNNALDENRLQNLDALLASNGIGGSKWIYEEMALLVHHIRSYIPKGKDFDKAIDAVTMGVMGGFGSDFAGRSSIWMQHEILSNDWSKNPNGEEYDKIIKRGQARARNLGIISDPEIVFGKDRETGRLFSVSPNIYTGKAQQRIASTHKRSIQEADKTRKVNAPKLYLTGAEIDQINAKKKTDDLELKSDNEPKVVELITRPQMERFGKLQDLVRERTSQMRDKINSWDGWKWSKGDRVKSKKTGKIYTITGRSWNMKRNEALYSYEYPTDGEQSNFRAELAHDSLMLMSGPKRIDDLEFIQKDRVSRYKKMGLNKPEWMRDEDLEVDIQISDAARMNDLFYSKMIVYVGSKFPGRSKASEYIKLLNTAQKAGHFKEEELAWSGAREQFLAPKGDDVVLLKDLIEHLETNNVKLEEVIYGEPSDEEIETFMNDEMGEGFSRLEAMEYLKNDESTMTPRHGGDELQLRGGHNYRELVLTMPVKRSEAQPLKPVDTSKWTVKTDRENKYTGQREVTIFDEHGGLMAQRTGTRDTDQEIKDQLAKTISMSNAAMEVKREMRNKVFLTEHYPDLENVIVHIRFNERIDLDGKKTLFIEEIQSDWHQKGRSQGYRMVGRPKIAWEPVPGTPFYRVVATPEGGGEKIEISSGNLSLAFARAEVERFKKGAVLVPNAPFKSGWQMIAMKRMVRWAAEGGFDRLAWTTGSQQIARYEDELRRNVDKIDWKKHTSKLDNITYGVTVQENFDGNFQVYVNGDPVGMPYNRRQDAEKNIGHPEYLGPQYAAVRRPVEYKEVTAEKDGKIVFSGIVENGQFTDGVAGGRSVEDVLGKAMAKKVNDQEDGSIEGKDLSIGGQLHKFVYDQNIPQEMNKFFGKSSWGNAKVGKTTIETKEVIRDAQVVSPRGHVWWTGRSELEAQRWMISNKNLPYLKDAVIEVGRKGGEVVHSIDITSQMKSRSLSEGFDAFELDIDGPPEIKQIAKDKIGYEQRPIKKRVMKSWDDTRANFQTRMFDKLAPIKSYYGKGPVYMLHRGLGGLGSTMNAFLSHGKLRWDADGALTTDTTGAGFVEWMREHNADLDKFFMWLIARRAAHLESQGREKLFDSTDRAHIDQWTAAGPSTAASWDEMNKEFQSWNKNALDIAEQSGLIDPASRAAFESDVYLPFYRIFEDEETAAEFLKSPQRGGKFLSAQIKRLKGSERKMGDPLENSLKNWTHLIGESMKNNARRKAFQDAQALNLTNSMGEPVVEEVSWADTVIFKSQGKMTFVTQKTGDPVLGFRDVGKSVFFKVNDPELFAAIGAIDLKKFNNAFFKVFGALKRTLTFGATLGPAFRIANMLRDTLHTSVVSKDFMPFWDTAKGFYKSMREDQDYVRLMASGNAFAGSYNRAEDPGHTSKMLRKLIKKEGRGVVGRILDTPKKMFDFWQKIGEASESAARVALYSNMTKRGATHLEASFAARDILDFQQSGNSEILGFFITTVPFLNARIQGLHRLGRGFLDNPAAFTLKGGMVTVASLLLWLLNKDDERYKALEDWDKWTYFHFWVGNTHIRIPKPFEVGALFASGFESAAEVVSGNEGLKFFLDWMKFTAMETFAFNPVPQGIRPIAEQVMNKSFFSGRPIEPMGYEFRRPGERFDPWDSKFLQVIGQKYDISPKRATSLIEGYLSGVGTALLFGADVVTKQVVDFPEDPTKDIGQYPAIGRFVKSDIPRNTKYASRFYDVLKEIQELHGTIEHLAKTGRIDAARELQSKNLEKMQILPAINNGRTQLKDLNHQVKKIWLDRNLSADQKKAKLDDIAKRKAAITKQIYDTYMKEVR